MGALYEKVVRPIMFRQDAENAHARALAWLALLQRCGPLRKSMESWNSSRGEPLELFGLKFPNPIGLAAGFDKDAHCWQVMGALGFGFVEIGTITCQEQPGNPKPRIWRFPEQQALINRMGFPNAGAEAAAARLADAPPPRKRAFPLGINIGKSKVVPLDHAVEDYLGSYRALADYADYFAINVSSPNTPDLRRLQEKGHLTQLLTTLLDADAERAKRLGKPRIPMLLKIAPDLTYRQIDEILSIATELELSGLIATNTLVERPAGFTGDKIPAGGLSGRPLSRKATDVVDYIYRSTDGKLPIIGVGGIMDERDAGAMFDAGASLIQIYTGMIYRGPFFARDLARAVSWRTREWV